MTTSKYDLAYGRQGGRIVPFVPPTPPPICDVCSQLVVSGMARHRDCEPSADDGQLDLFGGSA